ncbi:hypothetical protein ACIPVK_15795 [Paeniglutamicibacter sp. MACA_103]|uniref:hypothetical protein n=1 Tax=Paeniglutamicibacter sp. MACA_103 TaxID=3377337 RepID=UPI003894D854
MLPSQATSIRTRETKFAPASTTAMFMGWPISAAHASAVVQWCRGVRPIPMAPAYDLETDKAMAGGALSPPM